MDALDSPIIVRWRWLAIAIRPARAISQKHDIDLDDNRPTIDTQLLGGVDKFEPVSCCGEMDHAEEAVGQLIVSGRDSAVDLEMAEHAFDAIALLVERLVIVDFYAAV